MKFEWDEKKNKINIQKHTLDFNDASKIFTSSMLVSLDTRYDYNEDRWIGIGLIHNRIVVIVYVEQNGGEPIRIISLRKALKYERKRFKELI